MATIYFRVKFPHENFWNFFRRNKNRNSFRKMGYRVHQISINRIGIFETCVQRFRFGKKYIKTGKIKFDLIVTILLLSVVKSNKILNFINVYIFFRKLYEWQ